MTVIAWDGKSLAGDKRAVVGGGLIRTTTKIFSVLHGLALAGYAGDADAGEEMLAWFEDGYQPAKFPASQRDRDNWSGLLVVWGDGRIWKFERSPYPIKFPPQHFAIGSGRDFALMAMHLGKTAREAVKLASIFDSGCGNGVDELAHPPQELGPIVCTPKFGRVPYPHWQDVD